MNKDEEESGWSDRPAQPDSQSMARAETEPGNQDASDKLITTTARGFSYKVSKK